MRITIKNSWHPARWVLAFFCLAVCLALAATPLNQLRTRAQGEQPKGDKSNNAELSVIEVPVDRTVPFAPAGRVKPGSPTGQGYAVGDIEPNGTFGTASPLGAAPNVVVKGNLFPNGDIDFYSFTATAGDRVYAAAMTSWSAGSSTDSQLTLLASDGTTTIEFDDDNGSFASFSSSIAGATIPSTGTYFLKVNDFTAGTTTERPYELHLQVQSGVPTPEVEGNDTPVTANALPANGWVSGTRDPAAATEQDWYSLALNAGDTVYLSLDLDPERDTVTWNGRLGFALFGDAANQILVVDDAGTADTAPQIPSEALFMTVKTAGTYYAFVDSASALVGGPTATYHLSVSVHPATNEGVNCTTYTSTDVPKTIGPAAGLVSSTITVPGSPRIADVDVDIVLNHALMADIDAHLRSPAGNDNGLFTDIGATATGGQALMDLVLDDEAGIPPSFTIMKGLNYKPELSYRLNWFDGENAGGVWTLDLRDDDGGGAGLNGGTLAGWRLRICEQPPAPSCVHPSSSATTVFSTDFEAGAAGFTHSGTADEWELGLPATVATTTANPVAGFTTCNSGTNCWKTDLDNTYNVSSTQDLLSPNINLTGISAPLTLSWAQKYQMESATFDHYFVEVREVANPTNSLKVFEFYDATMTNAPGNPAVNVPESAGWGVFTADITRFVNKIIEVRFHVDSDTTVNFAGVAIDDVTVTACSLPSAANGAISGRILDNGGAPVAGAVVNLSGTQTRKTITDSGGNYRFDNVETNGFYTVTPARANYQFSPSQRSFSVVGNRTDATFAGTFNGDNANPLDSAEYFVRQQYLDVLRREPDESGFNYWSDQLNACGANAECIRSRRIGVAAAFFIEQEAQVTGSFIYNLYEGALGRRPAYGEYTTDRQQVVGGANLEAMKAAFAQSFVQRAEFAARYQGNASGESFVDALLANLRQSSGVELSSERGSLISRYNAGANQTESRSFVLRDITESTAVREANYNASFVLTEYFSYLGRDPDAGGYNFWLGVLNDGDQGNYRGMVCSFITSTEYQRRFSALVTHGNNECGQ